MKYLRFFLVLFAICIAVLLAVFHFYKQGYEKYYSFEYGRLNEIINGKSQNDILFIGSSRTFYHINPRVVDSITKLTSYNAGIDGANIAETKMIFDCYLRSHSNPKLVVLDIHRSSLLINDRPFWNPTIYYPFINNDIVFQSLRPYQHVYLLKYFPAFRFIEADDLSKENSLLGYFNKEAVKKEDTYGGYFGYSNDTIVLPFRRMYGVNTFPIEKGGVEILKQIIKTCKLKGIALIVTYPPVYRPQEDIINPELFPTIQKVCSINNIPFLIYNQSIWNDHKLFREELHLNNRGANLFSTMLANDLNELVYSK